MLAELYHSIGCGKLREGKRKLALLYFRLSVLQIHCSYIFLLDVIEGEVWAGEWANALLYSRRMSVHKLSRKEKFRFFFCCARIYNQFDNKRKALYFFDLAMNAKHSGRWNSILRKLRRCLPLSGRVYRRFYFPGGFANNGCILHFDKKAPVFITKFYKDRDNYIRESFFYGSCAPLLSSSLALNPVSLFENEDELSAICLPYVSQAKVVKEPIKNISLQGIMTLITDLGSMRFSCMSKYSVPKYPLSFARNMVNLRNVLFNLECDLAYKCLRKMLLLSLRKIKSLRSISSETKHYALELGVYFLRNHCLKDMAGNEKMLFGLCHADLKADNVLASNDKGYLVIDWGNFSFGPLGYDLATFVSEAGLDYDNVDYLLEARFPFSDRNKLFTWWACYFHCLRNLEKKQEKRIGDAMLFLKNNIFYSMP